MLRARFIGDPAERSGEKPWTRAAGDWFDVPEGMEAKYAGNSHYEVSGEAEAPKPKRGRPRKIVTEEANGELPTQD